MDTTDTDRSASYLDLHLEIDIVNFPFICSNIPAATAYGVYISASLFDKVDQSDDLSDHIKRK
jgi:hypothetical protein